MAETFANKRSLRDRSLKTTKALPAAGASADHDGIDTGGVGPHREGMQIVIEVPILAALVDTKLVTFELEHSADNITFTDVGDAYQIDGAALTTTGALSCTVAGTETPGTANAATFALPIPAHCNRYVRVNQTVEAAGGDNTGDTITVYLQS